MKSGLRLLLGLVAFVVLTSKADGPDDADLIQGLQSCRFAGPDSQRLACYDRLARLNAPANYAGKLGFRSDLFYLSEPHRVRFRSYGVIFVLYLLNDKNTVVQNLHLGGVGEGAYILREPGHYQLQVDASARWKIWLEPLSAANEANTKTTSAAGSVTGIANSISKNNPAK